MPPYVARGGEQAFPPPYQTQDVAFYGFVLDSTYAALNALCDRYINNPSNNAVRVYPLVPKVLLGIADIHRFRVGAPVGQPFLANEIDVAFWVPVIVVRRGDQVDLVDRFAWLLPYVLVNHPWGMASGRESLGFPKATGTIAIQGAARDLRKVSVDVHAVQSFGTNAPCAQQRLLELVRTDERDTPNFLEAWTTIEQTAEKFFRELTGTPERIHLPGIDITFSLPDFLIPNRQRMLFLKQFRDCADPAAACYQGIIDVPTRVTGFHGGGILPGDYELRISQFASHPIAQELGLSGGTVSTSLPIYFNFDFDMDIGTEVWKA